MSVKLLEACLEKVGREMPLHGALSVQLNHIHHTTEPASDRQYHFLLEATPLPDPDGPDGISVAVYQRTTEAGLNQRTGGELSLVARRRQGDNDSDYYLDEAVYVRVLSSTAPPPLDSRTVYRTRQGFPSSSLPPPLFADCVSDTQVKERTMKLYLQSVPDEQKTLAALQSIINTESFVSSGRLPGANPTAEYFHPAVAAGITAAEMHLEDFLPPKRGLSALFSRKTIFSR